jgi:glucose-6-phosphate isomerase
MPDLDNTRSIAAKKHDNFLFVTESFDNSIAKIAKKIGSEIVLHPKEIGGRFSCFSVVGLLPAMLAGVDVSKVR